MDASAIDPGEFREAQRKQWNVAATGWDKWSQVIDEGASVASDRLVQLAGIEPGSRVLDVACGYGEPALTAAKAAAPDGEVVATDIAAEMLAFGRNRAEAAGVDNIEFVQGAANDLEFPEGSFDAAVSRWGIIFDPDGEGAAGRVRGFLKPGGRFAIASWGSPERVPFLSVPMKTVMDFFDVPPPPPGTPGPLSRPTPDAIGGLLEGGGFSDVEVEEIELAFTYDSPEEFTVFVREIAPPITALMASQPEDRQAEAWDAITEAMRQFASDDGTLAVSSLALLASGRA